ncbi:hypothetical protein QF001_000682 [Paraburkholderia youngii]
MFNTNIWSTFFKPRTITWRMRPTVLAQPKPCSINFRFCCGFRARVAERDTYRLDRCVLPPREQWVVGALNVHARKTGAGHLLPHSNSVLYYVPCIYVSLHAIKSGLM